MITKDNATHLFCGKHYCVKTLEAHGVKYDFNEDVDINELLALRNEYTGKQFYKLPEIKPMTLNGYPVYQGIL